MPKVIETKLEKRDKPKKVMSSFYLIIILVILIFIALAYFFIWPDYEFLVGGKSKLLSQKNLLTTQNNYLENLKKLISNYESINSADREKLSLMLPKEVDEPDIFALFESLAGKNKMAILAVDISEKEPPAEFKSLGIKEIDIAANLAGGEYSDLKNLLNDLESNLRLMDIVSVNYTPDSASYILNIRTYRLE